MYGRRSKVVQDVFCISYVNFINVVRPGGSFSIIIKLCMKQMIKDSEIKDEYHQLVENSFFKTKSGFTTLILWNDEKYVSNGYLH